MTISSGVLTPAQYVNTILGSGVTISNVTFSGNDAQIGTFGGTSNIGFPVGGVVLSTGAVSELVGIASATAAGQTNVSGIGNGDLYGLATSVNNSGGTISNTTDLSMLEFDFVPSSNQVTFNFVFASEEYLVWANSVFNDVFGFFVSGPGISGPYSAPNGFANGSSNFALVPGTTYPVTVNTIHPNINSQYYVSNDGGLTHTMNGFTVPLEVNLNVAPGFVYHIKLAIADCSDNYLSSAIFIGANSFISFGSQANFENHIPSNISISPNPTYDYIKVSIPEQFTGVSYDLSDQCGKTVFKGNLSETTNTIDLTNLAKGIYFFSVEGMAAVERVVKN